VIKATIARPIHIRTILPERVQAFPWAGHLGLRMFPAVLASLDPARSTLLFTNTRSQAELWHRAIRFAKPEWEARLAIHHGSIDRDERERVEGGIKSGEITLVVATSSLDLGVDFAPVERVYQIGSPKGVGRMIQRAGRASHRPGASCEIICVPTHAMELIEIDAVRRAIAQGVVEPRSPLPKPLDVLAQHLVTCALGGGIVPADFFDEVRSAHSYRTLTREEFNGTLALVTHGGDTLRVYPQFRKVVPDGSEAERHSVPDKRIATQHRLNVGTIVGEAVIDIQYASGRRLGTIEESFITMLRPGQKFLFAGKVVSYVGLHDMTAIVRPVPASAGSTGFTPHWAGTKLPITQSLGAGVRSSLHLAATPGAARESVELACAAPILASQARLSHVPAPDETLVEITRTREGTHLFVFPFEGRLVHAGLGAILALRLTRLLPIPTTFSIAVNDYGLELLSGDELALEAVVTPSLFETRTLAEDIVQSVDLAQVAKLPFREIVRVAGLVQQNYPGVRRSGRQQQASASLIYDVFREFDPGNLLLEQARREVFDRHFEQGRLARAMARVSTSRIVVATPTRPTPLAFPLIVERVSAKLSGETLADRLEKMVAQWDRPRDTPGASRRKEKHR
jgi:ATP-dependent Lhr-like helicase